MEKQLFTSESVSPGHPDKVCDYISDLILDAHLRLDPKSRVAVETLVKDDNIVLGGEITSTADVDIEALVAGVYADIGYDIKPRITNLLNSQSADIALGTNDDVGGAGDQGMMFGYACDETANFMPLAISIAHDLIKKADTLRKNGDFKWAKPDMKSQVTIDYSGSTAKVHTVLMSIQHDADYDETAFKEYIKGFIAEVVKSYNLNTDYKVLLNPTGRFVIGGPIGDAGVTGRKIIVDTYGGYSPHGGGAFSGKDPTKVDRSAAYMARYLAKNIVAAGLAKKCTIQLSYAIGIKEPISVNINLHDTGIDENKVTEKIMELVDLTPKGIIDRFDLKRPIYASCSRYGHFGAEVKDGITVPWEQLDLVAELKKIL